MTYNELLSQKEWWQKCNEILSRDSFRCKDCGSLGYHNGYSYITANKIEDIDNLFKGWTFNGMIFSNFCSSNLLGKNHPFKNIKFEKKYDDNGIYVYSLDLLDSQNKMFSDNFEIPEKVIGISPIEIDSLDATVNDACRIHNTNKSQSEEGWMYLFEFPFSLSNNIYVNIEYSTIFYIANIPYARLIFNITYNNRLFSIRFLPFVFHLKGLNIHHTYYLKGCKPWEYDNDSLVTLCEDCHKKRHNTSAIPLYDQNKKLSINLLPCDRCSGSGYLPQYSHIEHGICFKCYGEGVVIR